MKTIEDKLQYDFCLKQKRNWNVTSKCDRTRFCFLKVFSISNYLVSLNVKKSLFQKLKPLRPQIQKIHLIGRKTVGKTWRIFLPLTNFFADYSFLPAFNFYRRIFLPTLFYKQKHLVFSDLKIPLVYLFHFKFD